MNIELPDHHPLAKAIRSAVNGGMDISDHLFINLDRLTRSKGHQRMLSLEVTGWSQHGRTGDQEARLEVMLIDHQEHHRLIKAMMTWPDTDAALCTCEPADDDTQYAGALVPWCPIHGEEARRQAEKYGPKGLADEG